VGMYILSSGKGDIGVLVYFVQLVQRRVARFASLGKFGGSCNGPCSYILRHLVKFTAIWSILRLFGIFYGYQVYFPLFGLFYQEKSGNPGPDKKYVKKNSDQC
jgi:hypothetical protein